MGGTEVKFPPGKSGGLIEASQPAACRTGDGSRFRRVNPAASLKLGHQAFPLPEERVSAG